MKNYQVQVKKMNGSFSESILFNSYPEALNFFVNKCDNLISDCTEVYLDATEGDELEAGGIGHDYRITLEAVA